MKPSNAVSASNFVVYGVLFSALIFISNISNALPEAGISPATSGWVDSFPHTASNFTFDGEPKDICQTLWDAARAAGGYGGSSYVGYKATDDRNGDCLHDHNNWRGIQPFYRPKKREVCPYGYTNKTSEQYNREGTFNVPTTEIWLDGTNRIKWVTLFDDPGLQCLEPRKDVIRTEATHCTNPINLNTGIKTQFETDYQGSGLDALVFKRIYRSHESFSSGITGKWLMTSDMFLEDMPGVTASYPRQLRLSFTNGNRIHFTASGSQWVANDDKKGVITQNANGWEYTDGGNTKYQFNDDGQLIEELARNGSIKSYSYVQLGEAAGKIQTITNRAGKTLQLAYNSNGQLKSLTVPGGAIYQYAYDEDNRFASVTYPDDTPAYETDNHKRIYVYENESYPRALTGIIDERGSRYATWSYSNNRATSSEHANGTDKMTIKYVNNFTTEITNTRGQKTVYTFGDVNGVMQVTSVVGNPGGTCQ
ncbi:MAG: DUF6531 domain-containing protein [Agarilytica sp.]